MVAIGGPVILSFCCRS